MEIPIKMDDLGETPLFLETPISYLMLLLHAKFFWKHLPWRYATSIGKTEVIISPTQNNALLLMAEILHHLGWMKPYE